MKSPYPAHQARADSGQPRVPDTEPWPSFTTHSTIRECVQRRRKNAAVTPKCSWTQQCNNNRTIEPFSPAPSPRVATRGDFRWVEPGEVRDRSQAFELLLWELARIDAQPKRWVDVVRIAVELVDAATIEPGSWAIRA